MTFTSSFGKWAGMFVAGAAALGGMKECTFGDKTHRDAPARFGKGAADWTIGIVAGAVSGGAENISEESGRETRGFIEDLDTKGGAFIDGFKRAGEETPAAESEEPAEPDAKATPPKMPPRSSFTWEVPSPSE